LRPAPRAPAGRRRRRSRWIRSWAVDVLCRSRAMVAIAGFYRPAEGAASTLRVAGASCDAGAMMPHRPPRRLLPLLLAIALPLAACTAQAPPFAQLSGMLLD